MGIPQRQLGKEQSGCRCLRLVTTLVTLILFAGSISAQNAVYQEGKQAFYLGTCVLEQDPAADALPVKAQACVKATIGTLLTTDSDYQQSTWGSFGNIYLGAHWSNIASFHGRTNAYVMDSLAKDTNSKTQKNAIEELSVRIGNRALNPLTVTAGYQNLPFGLNLQPLSDYQPPEPTETFWHTEKLGIYASVQSSLATRLDIGFGVAPSAINSYATEQDASFAIRISKAISALDGTQFMASTYAFGPATRRAGLAMLNNSRRGESTGIEWIREVELNSDLPFKQIIRISYDGVRVKNGQWKVIYNHIFHDQRSGELAHHFFFQDYFRLLLGLKYSASDIESRPSHWTFTTGVAARL